MKTIGIFYGSDTGNTEDIANKIQEQLGEDIAEVHDASDATADDIEQYKYLVFGSSTQGIGEMQMDFEGFMDEINAVDLSEKTVAIFGLGDQDTYADTFCDAIGMIYDLVTNKGAKVVGQVDPEGYEFEDSVALRDDKFVGLPLDEDTQSDLTDERIENWVADIKQHFA
ncbi:MAG: flavodoxin [Flavobacteriia bacterium]|nr:MAG: flavodoxin [Flavobacteriia bacterium]